MKLVLKEHVENLGDAGEIVTVKDGFGRNFLIPRGLASVATKGAVKHAEELKKQAGNKIAENLKNAQSVADKLNATSITITSNAGEDGKLFGTITNTQVAEALKEKGFEIDRRKISIEDVKMLGEHTASITITADIKATVKVWVVKDEK